MENMQYRVVINTEQQYSLWLEHKEIPSGWVDAGCKGSREECLDYISKHWQDIRPHSLQELIKSQQ